MILKRCQHGEVKEPSDFRVFNGQHGEGCYFMPSNNKDMEAYYSRDGEKVHTAKIDSELVMDLSYRNWDYWDAKAKIYRHPEMSAFIFRHEGSGIPSGKEILVTDLSSITVIQNK